MYIFAMAVGIWDLVGLSVANDVNLIFTPSVF
jgi:hypothetical protein